MSLLDSFEPVQARPVQGCFACGAVEYTFTLSGRSCCGAENFPTTEG